MGRLLFLSSIYTYDGLLFPRNPYDKSSPNIRLLSGAFLSHSQARAQPAAVTLTEAQELAEKSSKSLLRSHQLTPLLQHQKTTL